MTRPRLLLVPEFTELAWGAVRHSLEEWADVASYDPPGVGAEPVDDADVERVRSGESSVHELWVRRGLEEVDRHGWEQFFVAADAWGIATAARMATERPAAVQGMALGHACLTFDMDSDRPAVSRPVWAAMLQLLRQDQREFIRHGIVQMTRGSVNDEEAAEMLERFPHGGYVEVVWEALGREHQPVGELLRAWGGPLLLAQHVGCITFTEEGFKDIVAAFPDAQVLRTPAAPNTTVEFVVALRDFCERVLAGTPVLRDA